MQPKTEVKFDLNSFERIKRTIKNMSVTYKNRIKDPSYTVDIPEEFGLQLTNKCNLRCKHCFQWSEEGFFHNMEKTEQQDEMDIETIKKIFQSTYDAKSNVYLWGGEPLCYGKWDELCNILEEDPRWTVLCTNGVLIDKKIDSICRISETLAVMMSLDGFEEENDRIRGKGTFKKVTQNIDLLMDLKRKGLFKGEVSVNCVISEAMADKLYDFMEFFEEKGINTVYFCFPWYIPKTTADRMDEYVSEKFNGVFQMSNCVPPSWHSYSHSLNSDIIPVLKEQIKKVNSRVWKIRIRFQPALEIDEIDSFISDTQTPAQGRKACLAMSTRLNIMASGEVTICKLFPEFVVGDLNKRELSEIWHCEKFTKFRETLGCGLMPVCSKCVLLYLHGI
ncbi:MAG TPA: radical SAM protein [Clostridia bacterium]